MKQKITALLCATFLSLGLAGCSSSQTQEDVLRVGMDLQFPPFSYIGDTGEAEGLEPLIAKAFADYVVFMKEGEIWEQGTIDCLDAHETSELAAFLSHEEVGV